MADGQPRNVNESNVRRVPLQMRSELHAAVSEMESALLDLKRSRLLAHLGGTASGDAGPLPPPGPTVLEPATTPAATADETGAPGGASGSGASASHGLPPGSACQFRYMDGRWYSGQVLGAGRQVGEGRHGPVRGCHCNRWQQATM